MVEESDADRIVAATWRARTKDRREDYSHARAGDHLMTPFECDWCIFRKLRGEEPDPKSVQDKYLMVCVRRMNLDAFWSRATSTVAQNTRNAKKMIEKSMKVGIPYGPFMSHGPFPSYDHCGYQVAYLMLDSSLDEGKYHTDRKQFDTIRKFRSVYSNHVRATPATLVDNRPLVLTDNNGKAFSRLGQDESGSLWFSRFVEGCRRRMGQDWRPDQAISSELVVALLGSLEEELRHANNVTDPFVTVMAGTFYAVSFALSLRGPEGLLLDLGAMTRYADLYKDRDCVVVCLWGQFKGEHSERAHLLPCCNVTGSGIKVRQWLNRAMVLSRDIGRTTGPLMMDRKGVPIAPRMLDDILHRHLCKLFDNDKNLFPLTVIKGEEDIVTKYFVFRSFRRGWNTRAKEVGVEQPDLETVNRWRIKERAGANKPGGAIDHMYADLSMLVGPFLRYSSAM